MTLLARLRLRTRLWARLWLQFHLRRFDKAKIIIRFYNVNRHRRAFFAGILSFVAIIAVTPELTMLPVFSRATITLLAGLVLTTTMLTTTMLTTTILVCVATVARLSLIWLTLVHLPAIAGAVLVILPLPRFLFGCHLTLCLGEHAHVMFGMLIEILSSNPII